MDTSKSFLNDKSSNLSFYRTSGVTPKKSPTTENVQRRRRDIEKSEMAAYWAIFNTSMALLLYYDLFYLKILTSISFLLTCIEWFICAVFTTSACYDFMIHFWPYTFMKPITISSAEKELLGVRDDEIGFVVEDPVKVEPFLDRLPPFEIYQYFDEFEEETDNKNSQKSIKS